MKKIVSSIFIVIMILVIATGCSSNSETPKNYDSNDESITTNKETTTKVKEQTTKTNTTTKEDTTTKKTTAKQTQKTTKSSTTTKQTTTTESSINSSTITNNTTQKRKNCSYGYTQDGDYCYKEYKAKTEYTCVEGKEAGGYCIINTSVSANATYTCQSGYTLSGTSCVKRVVAYVYDSSNYADVPETIRIQYYNNFLTNCNNTNGQVETVDGKKYCYDYEYSNPTITYDCKGKNGELAGNMCISAKTVEAFAKSSCPDGGTLQTNGKCRITVKAE